MNGRRRKILARKFAEVNGRLPERAQHDMQEERGIFINNRGMREFKAAKDVCGELHFTRFSVGNTVSEVRLLKHEWTRRLTGNMNG